MAKQFQGPRRAGQRSDKITGFRTWKIIRLLVDIMLPQIPSKGVTESKNRT